MNLLRMSLSASFLILAVIAFRKFFSSKMPRTVFLFLWMLAWCKLMIPIPTGFSVPVTNGWFENMPDITTALSIPATALQTAGTKPDFPWMILKILWSCGALAFSLYLGCLHIVNLKKYRAAIPLKGISVEYSFMPLCNFPAHKMHRLRFASSVAFQ